MKRFFPLLFLFSLLYPTTLWGQSVPTASMPGDSSELYARLLQLTGQSESTISWLIRPIYLHVESSDEATHPWAERTLFTSQPAYSVGNWIDLYLYEPVWFHSYNTARPRGGNDGALWQGKGYNSALSAGVRIEAGPLHLTFRPMAGFAENRSFDLGPYPSWVSSQPYSTRLRTIDEVVRFGPDSFSWFDIGETAAELRYLGLAAGISNHRLWTGPATHNPLLFSYNAPGFWHLHLSSYRPIRTPAGHFEFKYLFGAIRKSDYFDNRIDNRLNSIASLIFAWSPRWINGLSVGFNRSFLDRYPESPEERNEQIRKLTDPFLKINRATEENPFPHEPDNQMFTLFARWEVPGQGFEIYSEFGRNDANYEWLDFRTIPHHHRTWMIGALKTFQLNGNRLLSLNLEMTQLEESRSSMVLGGRGGAWYFHSNQIQGFTNRGQIMGAPIGPGGNSQLLDARLFTEQGSWGVTLSRTVYDNGKLIGRLTQIERANDLPADELHYWMLHRMDFTAGVQWTRFLTESLELTAAIDQTLILNEHYLVKNDLMNTRFELSLRYRLPGGIR